MRDNHERVKKLVARVQDLVDIIAGRFERDGSKARDDIEELQE